MHHSAIFNVQRRKKETGGHLIARMAVSWIFFFFFQRYSPSSSTTGMLILVFVYAGFQG